MKNAKQNTCAVVTALIWGTAFVAQSICSKYIGPFTTTALRSVIAALFLTLVVFIMRKAKGKGSVFADRVYFKKLVKSGIICGVLLATATNLQQTGIGDTGAGKTAFITAMYVVIVPVLSMFLGKKADGGVWCSVAIAVVGFYFLCLYGEEGIGLAVSDLFVLLCAFMFSVHIIAVDRLNDGIDGIELSCVQFYASAVVSLVCMFFTETPTVQDISQCIAPLLYISVFSSGIAYTLQIIAQKGSNPTIISLIFTLESVFAILAEHIISGSDAKPMMWWEILGCIFIFFAVVFAQIPFKKKT